VLKLNIASLSEGHTEAHLQAKTSDLDLDEYLEFGHPFDINLAIDKVGRNIFIKASLQSVADLLCDRCGEPFSAKLEESVQILYTTDRNLRDREDEDVFVISASEDIVDIKDPARETLILALPAKRLCKEDCKGLCASCGANLNEKACACQTIHIDPRWQKLQDLLK
jgi:uncharacterized protein